MLAALQQLPVIGVHHLIIKCPSVLMHVPKWTAKHGLLKAILVGAYPSGYVFPF